MLDGIQTDMSFLEMLDVLNEKLTKEGKDPVAFDHDCREGICGMCGAVVNGVAHGPEKEITLCQLHMRNFQSGDILVIEPFRSRAFPLKKDLLVDRSALDRIIQAGGYVSVNTGGTPDGNSYPDSFPACRTGHGCRCLYRLRSLCRQLPERRRHALHQCQDLPALLSSPRARRSGKNAPWQWSRQMDEEGFGNCTNARECEAVCPKGISIRNIARLNKEYLRAVLSEG